MNLVKFFKSVWYAIQGIAVAFQSEDNLKIDYEIMGFVIVFGWTLKISMTEWIVCILLFVMVISAEMLNTAIEKTMDMITDQIDPRVKFIKDVSAGAVLVVAIGAAVIGCLIFLPKLFG